MAKIIMAPKHFFKKTSKNKSRNRKNQFPSISRLINDPIILLRLYRGSLKAFLVIIFLLAVAIVGYDLQNNLKIKKDIDFQREELVKELKFWESFLSTRQDYRDAYFKASILEYRLGNTSKSKTYVEKGLSLDPNSQTGKKIEDFLKGE